MSLIGEAALSALFEALFVKFNTSFDLKLNGGKQIRKEIEYWEQTLKNMHTVLSNAEERQIKDQLVKFWLADLQDLAYDVDDILDEFATQALGSKLMSNESQASLNKVQKLVPNFCTVSSSLHPTAIMFNNKLMSKIKHITKRLKHLETQKGILQLIGFRVPAKMVANRPPSTSLVNEAQVYGRGKDKEALINLILRDGDNDGASGSKIIITTRSSNVASIVKTVSDFSLEKLSDDDSLAMFVHHALGARDFSGHLNLKEIGLGIVKKCNGLPLATKTIAGLLRGRMDPDAWKDILEKVDMVLTSTLPLPQGVFLTRESFLQQHPLPSSPFKPCCSSSSHHHHNNNSNHRRRNHAFSLIQDSAIIACLRANRQFPLRSSSMSIFNMIFADQAMGAARAAVSGGIEVLEIVRSTPGVFEVLKTLVKEYPTKAFGVMILPLTVMYLEILQVGTVLNVEDTKTAINAGAKFLMSPATVKDIIDDVQDADVLYIPGVMTPTEILSAYNAGAKIVKIYPVSALGGTRYISAIMKPFSHIPMVASQGITLDSVGEYIAQGAISVVLSDAIFDKGAMSQNNFNAIHQLAKSAALQGKSAVER
ncbi:KDPG/KHG aldolase [Corchorus olitorius]|uniref:KDPG/KHG aldolase n=1 Tax=Corchorus olitorius TaxID=93759 RepID=A0A1R3KT63_9ROSI|nr:KDPG/KHG aldolase [Corchorus olitorius]